MTLRYKTRAEKDEITCEECVWSRVRLASGRLECTLMVRPYQVSRKGTCERAGARKEE